MPVRATRQHVCRPQSGRPDWERLLFVIGGSLLMAMFRCPICSDYATIKYSSAGMPLWTNRYDNGPGNDSSAASVAVDGSNNVIVTGTSCNGVDHDYATIQYSSAGV